MPDTATKPEGRQPVPLQPGDEVSFELTAGRLPSMSQRVIGKVEAVRDDGLVTAAFPQEGWSPMLVTAPDADFVRIRRSPDLEAVEARVRADVAKDLAAIFSKRAQDERVLPGNWALANDWDVAAQVCEDYATAPAESVVGAPRPPAGIPESDVREVQD